MSASKPQESGSVRIERSLNKYEEEFVARRRKDVLQSLKKLEIACSENEVPNIALLGSGGGERAMVGLLGSLDQLKKTGLLDCVLYLSGVSGSTWCMASLYQEPDWSTKLETVKNKIIQRLSGPAVSWEEAYDKLKKYYYEKDQFSLTDFWAAMFITGYVKEIDEHTLSDYWDQKCKDPFPVYKVIDKHGKQNKDADPWFEITPYEAGYSLTGAFVETSSFGSKFENGRKTKNQPQIDMLYLQEFIPTFTFKSQTGLLMCTEMMEEESDSPPIDECYQDLMDLVDMNLSALNVNEPTAYDECIRTGQSGEISEGELPEGLLKFNIIDIKQRTKDVFEKLNRCFSFEHKDLWKSIFNCMDQWLWGREYDFLHKMKDAALPSALHESETRDFEDAGLLLNSPYFPVLRKERHIDLIISLDFSDGDPLTTVKKTAETCGELNIPFPEVNIPNGHSEEPMDFYVLKGQNAPTVIHIPLFNVVNCGGKLEEWRKKYKTFQGPYSAEMITDLMEVAGKNITNNKDNLLEQIRDAIKKTKDE